MHKTSAPHRFGRTLRLCACAAVMLAGCKTEVYRGLTESQANAMMAVLLKNGIEPEKTADKKKLGFPVPVRAWLREEKYAAIVREKFQSESAEKFFNTRELTKMLDQHMSEKRDNWRQIWCVFMFLTWYEEYFVKR